MARSTPCTRCASAASASGSTSVDHRVDGARLEQRPDVLDASLRTMAAFSSTGRARSEAANTATRLRA